MAQAEDYKHIRAWGESLCSFSSYIQNEQRKAAEDNAPIDAIYKRQNGTWATVNEIASDNLRNDINERAASY